MVVGVLRFVLSIPGSGSLKAKRHVLRKVIDRVRARYNVSVAEVADNDLWQKASVGVTVVGNDRSFVNEVLDKVLRSVEEGGAEAFVVSHDLELLTFADLYGGGAERTLAEAEGLTGPFGLSGIDDEAFDDDEGYPSLEELEAAAEEIQGGPPPSNLGSHKRRRR